MKIFNRHKLVVIKIYLIYLLIYIITVAAFYFSELPFKSWIFYTKWALWFYILCFAPFFAAVIIAIRQYQLGTRFKFNIGVQFLILLIISHAAYGISASSYKVYVLNLAENNGERIKSDLSTVHITKPVMSLESGESENHNNYIVSMSIVNPLPYEISIKMDSRTSNQETLYLVDRAILPNHKESIRFEVSDSIMDYLLSNFSTFFINYHIKEWASNKRISERASISHELCKWALIGCPDFGSILPTNPTYPFNDKVILKRTGHQRRGVLTKFKKTEIEALGNQLNEQLKGT